MFEVAMSSHGPGGDEVVQRQRIEGPESTPWTLYGLVNRFGRRINAVRIVASSPRVLDIVSRFELLKALHASIVNVLGVGDELGRRRRRSVGSRHFEWRTG